MQPLQEVQPLGIAMRLLASARKIGDRLRNTARHGDLGPRQVPGYPIYSYMAKAITDKVGHHLQAARVSWPFHVGSFAPAPNGPISIEARRMVEEIVVVAPVLQGPAESGQRLGFCSVLAFGYSVSMMLSSPGHRSLSSGGC